jgi:hypothetical protein
VTGSGGKLLSASDRFGGQSACRTLRASVRRHRSIFCETPRDNAIAQAEAFHDTFVVAPMKLLSGTYQPNAEARPI